MQDAKQQPQARDTTFELRKPEQHFNLLISEETFATTLIYNLHGHLGGYLFRIEIASFFF